MFLRGISHDTGKWSCQTQRCGNCPFSGKPECRNGTRDQAFNLALTEAAYLIKHGGKTKEEIDREKVEERAARAKKSLFAKAYNDAIERFNRLLNSNEFVAYVVGDVFRDIQTVANSEEGACTVCGKRRYCRRSQKGQRRPCADFEYSYLKRFTDVEYDNLQSCGEVVLQEEDLEEGENENGEE